MELLIPSFFAGVLTVLAPCVLTLLPVILGGSATSKNKLRPLIISLSLGVSVVLFTLLLKGATIFINIPDAFWRYFSGSIVLLFGATLLLPNLWTKFCIKTGIYKTEGLLHKNSEEQETTKGAIILGASLGPVFTTCSPTYAIIIATVLPQNLSVATINLVIYAIGLMIPLLLIGYGGRSVVSKFKGAANPNGWFKKTLGLLLILTGLAIITGFDKTIENFILDSGYLGPIEIEQNLIEKFEN